MKKRTEDISRATNWEELREALEPQYTWYEKLFLPFGILRANLEEKREKRKFKRQRGKKGYADCDVWEMRTWFVDTARPILLEMSERVNNHPDELTFEEWRGILKRMAYLLELMDVWDDSALRKELGISADEKSDSVTEQLFEKRMEAKEEFFSLYNKWFFDLWY